jgi:hypothetical protein
VKRHETEGEVKTILSQNIYAFIGFNFRLKFGKVFHNWSGTHLSGSSNSIQHFKTFPVKFKRVQQILYECSKLNPVKDSCN